METRIFEFNNKKFHMTAAFQPIVSLREQKIDQYEALARFSNEEGIAVSTQKIIDSAEKSGSVDIITDFIFKLVCSLIAKKRNLKVSFNFSHALLNDTNYPEKFYLECATQGVDPKNIEIEISEKVTKDQLLQCERFLKKAKEFGFSVSLDDFGAGNIQLDSLGLFHFDTIKIDRSIVDGIGHDEVKRRSLHHILTNILQLDVKIICEGVEKKADLNLLKKYNNIGVQGYIFYYPLTIRQLKLLEAF